ncbi:MAG: HD domain-containing phosphohydrolase [bacterium]
MPISKIRKEIKEKVLVVDDESHICKLCYDLLSNAGYSVETISDPIEALNQVSLIPFDLVLTDIKMPQLDGLELVRKLKALSPEIPVVLMTGHATLEVAVQAVQEGASNFVRKPFNVDEILIAIQSAIERKKLLQENIRLKTLFNFFKVSEEISFLHEPSKIYSLLLEAAVKETKADRGGIFELDPENEQIFLRYGFNLDGLIEKEKHFQKYGGLPGKVLRNRSSIIINNWDNSITNFGSIGEEQWSKTAIGVPLKLNGSVNNILCLYKNKSEFSEADKDGAVILASHASIALENADLVLDLEILFLETMKSLAKTLDERDPYTHGHSKRVAQVAVAIGKNLGLQDDQLEELEWAGNLHDIGKIGIPDSVLFKKGSLTLEEYEIIKTHTEKGFNILKHIKRLSSVVEAVYSHHEWHNGQGYPRGLQKDNIPLAGAIIAVADAFDTIVTDRHYRKRRSYEKAIKILAECAGEQFNPTVVEALRKVDKIDLPYEHHTI